MTKQAGLTGSDAAGKCSSNLSQLNVESVEKEDMRDVQKQLGASLVLGAPS